jgi:hypothetical protein
MWSSWVALSNIIANATIPRGVRLVSREAAGMASRRQHDASVYLEVGTRRVFAAAVDWPGWCRSGKTEHEALDALATYAPRYATVPERAGFPFRLGAEPSFVVVERVPGDATTEFGAPGQVPDVDRQRLTSAQATRLASLVEASWAVLDDVVAHSSPVLRRGPRGGGRDRDKVAQHVLAAEQSYGRKIGVRQREPALDDPGAVAAFRAPMLAALRASRGGPVVEGGWPARYAARRIAWHALDHAWEIEDKQPS